ncbi:mitochondrial coenzyme A transporter SLC25A42 [Contarinia nasturtii]|uniref:mitochondrial coenzyme A transporter SLC25A42 n=1 Tax=Contarinia nasturtii TaxID=265458 RepID=UPI0012D4AEA4|nr:mitochondrial coenzyme A transporter SLC25A42 [Contarinia nasturtii]
MLRENTTITNRQLSTNHDNKNLAQTNVNTVVINLFCGALAGGTGKTVIAPLDRAKINFQIHKDIPYSFRAATLFLRNTLQNEGFFALWRGNSATMARIIPYAAIQFTSHEQWKKVLSVDKDQSTSGRRFLAGSLAGITSQSCTYPLDLARARMAVTDKYTGYKSLRQVFVKIWIDEGPRTLFRGYGATILGVIPYAGTSFFTFETLKRKHHDLTGEKPQPINSFVYGSMAGVIGQTTSYPLDIVRRRMQTVGMIKQPPHKTIHYQTIWSSIKIIYKNEGIRKGFFKGLSMNWVKGPIAVGISFTTFEYTKDFLTVYMSVRSQ